MAKTPLSNSSYNKWRCLIALAHIDKKLQPTEKEFFSKKLSDLGHEAATAEQLDTFRDDLENPKNPEIFFKKVEDRLEKLDLLRLAYELFWIDGEFDERERKAYEAMRGALSKSLDIDRFALDDLAKMRGRRITLQDIIRKTLDEG